MGSEDLCKRTVTEQKEAMNDLEEYEAKLNAQIANLNQCTDGYNVSHSAQELEESRDRIYIRSLEEEVTKLKALLQKQSEVIERLSSRK